MVSEKRRPIPKNYFANHPDIRIVGYIYETRNYDLFRKMGSNRNVSPKRKEALKRSLAEHEILNPIVANGALEIADGQGRFDAKRDLDRPIQFVVSEEATIEDCRRINRCNTPWEIMDYVYSYADDGKEDYIRIRECYEELNHIPVQRILRFINRSQNLGIDSVREGKLIFTNANYEMVRDIHLKCQEILSSLCFSKRVNEAFYTAVKIMIETNGYDHSKMLKNCSKCRSTYAQMSNLEDQLKEFSRIFNYKTQKGKIYFEDYMRNKGHAVRDYQEAEFWKYTREDVSTLKR